MLFHDIAYIPPWCTEKVSFFKIAWFWIQTAGAWRRHTKTTRRVGNGTCQGSQFTLYFFRRQKNPGFYHWFCFQVWLKICYPAGVLIFVGVFPSAASKFDKNHNLPTDALWTLTSHPTPPHPWRSITHMCNFTWRLTSHPTPSLA